MFTQNGNSMKMSGINPTRRWNCNEMVTKVDKHVYKIPLYKIVSLGIGATTNEAKKNKI